MSLFRPIWQLLKTGHRWQSVKFACSVWLQDPTLYPLNVHPVFDTDLCERMFIRNQTLLHALAKSTGSQALRRHPRL